MYFDQVWDKEIYTGGCPVGLMPPGVMIEYGQALRAPVGRIHWAGTETATVWTGYMDGAVQAGKRAAAEALARLVSQVSALHTVHPDHHEEVR